MPFAVNVNLTADLNLSKILRNFVSGRRGQRSSIMGDVQMVQMLHSEVRFSALKLF